MTNGIVENGVVLEVLFEAKLRVSVSQFITQII